MSQLQAVPAHVRGRLVTVGGTQLWVEVEGRKRSGSFSHVEEPERVLRLVREFLADLEPANTDRPAAAGVGAP